MDFSTFEQSARPSPEEAQKLRSRYKKQCKKAAKALLNADVLVVITGAGFSADSGLAVYADVARVPAYLKLGVTYQDLCQPHWLSRAPSLFYGFWGQCFNDYRDTKPHPGYGIIAKWRDDKNTSQNGQAVAEKIRKRIQKKQAKEEEEEKKIFLPPFMKNPPYPVKGEPAGAFFCYTSNVDAHWYDVCEPQEIHECHGNVELWHCADPYSCQSGIWRAPFQHRFLVDQESMEAPPSTHAASSSPSASKEDESDDDADSIDRIFQKLEKKESLHRSKRKRKQKEKGAKPKRKLQKMDEAAPPRVPVIGHVLGKKNRQNLLKHMPDTTNQYQWRTQIEGEIRPTDNWPKCGKCQQLARPAILMFGDVSWLPDEVQKKRWMLWKYSLLKLCRERQKKKQAPLKVCILEIGCGMNVPTCRVESEQLTEDVLEKGGEVSLIRINPDFPLASFPNVRDSMIPIMSRGLEAIEKMDHYYKKIKSKTKN